MVRDNNGGSTHHRSSWTVLSEIWQRRTDLAGRFQSKSGLPDPALVVKTIAPPTRDANTEQDMLGVAKAWGRFLAVFTDPVHVQLRLGTLSAADHKIVCDFEEGCTSLESQVRRKRRRALSRRKGSC